MAKKELIAEEIRNKIVSGELAEGAPVFSRVFSTKYKVNLKTANAAIWMLAGEGLLFNRPGAGYFVSAGARARAKQRAMAQIREELSRIMPRANALGLKEKDILGMLGNSSSQKKD